MPTLLEYINQLQREHKYRIKMVFKPSDRQLESLERHMKKYDALEVSRPEKLMLQAMPPSFPNYGGAELTIVDVTTRLPVSPAMLQAELVGLLRATEGTLKAFSFDDPLIQDQIASEKVDLNAKYEAKIGSDYNSKDENPIKANEVAGDEYVESLVKNAAKDDRRKIVMAKETDAKTSGPELNVKTNSPSPLTKKVKG
jgi:hypothetical protein